MSQVTWYLDDRILERLIYGQRKLPDVIRSNGYEVVVVQRNDNGSYPDVVARPEQCSVLFGSHEFVRALTPGGRFQPGGLGVNQNTQATAYMSNLPLEWFLNRFSDFMTWGMFKWRLANLPGSLPWNDVTGKLFIRPNSGFKTFAGTVLDLNKDLALDVKTIDELTGVSPETLIMVNHAAPLDGEFRFVIADRKVVAGSEYRWDGKLDVRRDWPQSCWDLAQKVAEHEWQVDIAYTCDVALLDGEPRIVELNGFSCAGLYACDLDLVVQGVSGAALREWSGLDLD